MLRTFHHRTGLGSLTILSRRNRPYNVIRHRSLSSTLLGPFTASLFTHGPVDHLVGSSFLTMRVDRSLRRIDHLVADHTHRHVRRSFVVALGNNCLNLNQIVSILGLVARLGVRRTHCTGPLALLPNGIPVRRYLAHLLRRTHRSIVYCISVSDFGPFGSVCNCNHNSRILLYLTRYLGSHISPSHSFIKRVNNSSFLLILNPRS